MFSKITFVSKIFPKYLKSSHYHKVDKNNSGELTLWQRLFFLNLNWSTHFILTNLKIAVFQKYFQTLTTLNKIVLLIKITQENIFSKTSSFCPMDSSSSSSSSSSPSPSLCYNTKNKTITK